MNSHLDYNEVVRFMDEFGIDYLNKYDELMIDVPHNIYTSIKTCKSIEDVIARTVLALTRPIGKELNEISTNRLLSKINTYFNVQLTKEDMLLIYHKLGYIDKLEELKQFIEEGFPMEQLK